jgi:hypothetical protein
LLAAGSDVRARNVSGECWWCVGDSIVEWKRGKGVGGVGSREGREMAREGKREGGREIQVESQREKQRDSEAELQRNREKLRARESEREKKGERDGGKRDAGLTAVWHVTGSAASSAVLAECEKLRTRQHMHARASPAHSQIQIQDEQQHFHLCKFHACGGCALARLHPHIHNYQVVWGKRRRGDSDRRSQIADSDRTRIPDRRRGEPQPRDASLTESQNGRTPLHKAASMGCSEAVAALLAARADVHAKDVSGGSWDGGCCMNRTRKGRVDEWEGAGPTGA